MKIAKKGDTIEWWIEEKPFRGFHKAKVSDVNEEDYFVWAEYGPDKIPFDAAKIIKEKQTILKIIELILFLIISTSGVFLSIKINWYGNLLCVFGLVSLINGINKSIKNKKK